MVPTKCWCCTGRTMSQPMSCCRLLDLEWCKDPPDNHATGKGVVMSAAVGGRRGGLGPGVGGPGEFSGVGGSMVVHSAETGAVRGLRSGRALLDRRSHAGQRARQPGQLQSALLPALSAWWYARGRCRRRGLVATRPASLLARRGSGDG
jgi:hypothetical protein